MSREQTNPYGYTKAETKEFLERQRLETYRKKALEENKKRQQWNNFLDAMCGTGIIKKTY